MTEEITIKCPYTSNELKVEYEIDTDETPVWMNPVTDSIKYETSEPYVVIQSINGLVDNCFCNKYLEEVSKLIENKALNND